MTLEQRFLKYVAFDTQSDPKSETYPSTAKQLALLNHLLEEMTTLGLHDVEIDPNGYVTGTIPATPGCESAPVVGFISHVDTSPDMKGSDIRPGIIERYDGGDIALNDTTALSPEDFPILSRRFSDPIPIRLRTCVALYKIPDCSACRIISVKATSVTLKL